MSNSDNETELNFIDGPLARSTRITSKDWMRESRHCRYLQPLPFSAHKNLRNETIMQVIEWYYIPIPLPRFNNQCERFAMVLDKS